MTHRTRVIALLAATATATTLVACSSESEDTTATTTEVATETTVSTEETTVAAASEFTAVTIDNCGFEFTVEEPVQRATTMEQGATDTLLQLGAAEQIAGHGHYKSHPPAGHEAELEALTVISEDPPTSEQLRAADTDFVYSPFELSWDPAGAGTREEWAELGVPTYNNNTECQDYGDNAGKTQFELLEKDFRELGQIFDREEEAEELIETQNAALQAAEDASGPEGTTFAVLYSAYGSDPYIAGGPSIATEMGDLFGMVNVFEDVDEEWPTVSWEAFADADPDIIILVDIPLRGSPGDKWEEKVELLEGTPGARDLDAVLEERYIIVDAVTMSASSRSHEAVTAIAEALRDGILES